MRVHNDGKESLEDQDFVVEEKNVDSFFARKL